MEQLIVSVSLLEATINLLNKIIGRTYFLTLIKAVNPDFCASVVCQISRATNLNTMDLPKLCTTRLLDQNFGMCISPQDILMPFFNNHSTNYFRPWKLCEEIAKKDFGSTIDDAKDNFKITLDVQHFRPNEISVKVNEREITIEGKHEDRQDDHGFISRQFTRRYALPKDCLSDSVTSTLSSDGVLTIIAKKTTLKEIKDSAKVIPIKMCEKTKTEAIEEKTNFSNAKEEAKLEKCDKKSEVEKEKMDTQCMLKEEHCRLLKPELLQEAASGTEKLLSATRKETDELLKLISADKIEQMGTSGKVEEALGQCKTAISELKKEKMSDMSMSAVSEMSSMKSSMMSETIESKESSSFMSMSSTMTATSEKTSDIVSEIIRAELKEAAENI